MIDATESGYTDSSISETFNIARKTIYNWKKKLTETGSLKPRKREQGPGKIQDLEKFRKFVEEKPDRSSEEMAQDWGIFLHGVFVDTCGLSVLQIKKTFGYKNRCDKNR
ncbi:MAG: IS630 transposase-related protein, partial [Oligoflexales bacterium]